MYPDLNGRVAVITGAGSGIGRACAIRMAEENCRLILNDIDAENAEQTRQLLPNPKSARVITGDIGDPDTAEKLSRIAVETFGALHIWVNNAAFVHWNPVGETTNDDWQKVLQVTLTGAFYGVKAALSAMRNNPSPPRGAIINIASGAALAGEAGLGAYGAAKAALVNLTRTTAVEYAEAGIRSNAVLPGPIATPPMLAAAKQSPGGVAAWEAQIVPKRLGQPEEIANAVSFLASAQASYINGVVLSVDGGVSARTNSPRFSD